MFLDAYIRAARQKAGRLTTLMAFAFLLMLETTSCATTASAAAVTAEPPVTREHEPASYMRHLAEQQDYLTADITYPVFTAYPRVTEAIADAISTDYAGFAELAREDAADGYGPYEYRVDCAPVIQTDSYISVLIQTYKYEGGAHGNTELRSFTYDVAGARFIGATDAGLTLQDLAARCQAGLPAAITASGAEPDDDWIASGTQPLEESFQTFTYDGDALTVYFPPYSVAPHSAGIVEVTVEIP